MNIISEIPEKYSDEFFDNLLDESLEYGFYHFEMITQLHGLPLPQGNDITPWFIINDGVMSEHTKTIYMATAKLMMWTKIHQYLGHLGQELPSDFLKKKISACRYLTHHGIAEDTQPGQMLDSFAHIINDYVLPDCEDRLWWQQC